MRIIPIMAAILLGLAIAGAAWAQSETRILRYDDKGRVIGVIEKKSGAERAAPAPATPPRELRNRPVALENLREPGEVMVVDPPAGFLRALRGQGYAVLERITLESFGLTVLRLRTPAGVNVEQALRAIGAIYPGVAIGANQYFEPGAARGGDYGRRVFGWGEVPPRCGEGIRIGMIDTIVDNTHPALQGQRIARRSFLGKGAKPGRSDHGTAIAAILVGKGVTESGNAWNGLLPAATLYAANIFAQRKGGRIKASLASMLKALDWLAGKNVQVVNVSLAGSANRVFSLLIERAAERGMIIVAAAGNGGARAKPAFPAAYPKVLAVTAIDQRLAIYRYANQGGYIDFAAPGVRLWTATKDGGGLQSGTSFAAPFITGTVALQLARGVEPDPKALREILRGMTRDLGPPGRDAIFGWGLVRFRPDC